MSPSDRVLFESVTHDLLQELGYEAGAPRRTISFTEQSWWKLNNTCMRILWRLNTKREATLGKLVHVSVGSDPFAPDSTPLFSFTLESFFGD